MIDNMFLVSTDVESIGHLTKSFFEKRKDLFERFNNEWTYKLFNPDNLTESYLRVTAIKFGKVLLIQGSIRKWYYGDISLNDFTKDDFEYAIRRLLSLLEIPFSRAKYIHCARIEIGMNVRIGVPCSEMLNMITGFRNNCYKWTYRCNSKKYETGVMSLNIYNKIEEISKNFPLIKTLDEEQFLKETKDKNILRLEFTVKGGKSKVEKRLGFNTLSETIKNFNQLFLFFDANLKDLELNEKYKDLPKYNGASGRDATTFLKLRGICSMGEDEYQRLLSEVDRRTRKTIKDLMNSWQANHISYGKVAFWKDVRRDIILAMLRSGCLKLRHQLSTSA